MVWSLLCSLSEFHCCTLRPWPLTSEINMVHPLIIRNICAKFDQNTLSSLTSFVFTRLYSLLPIVTLISKIKMVHPFLLSNIRIKVHQNTLNSLIYIVFIRLFPYLIILTLKSLIKRGATVNGHATVVKFCCKGLYYLKRPKKYMCFL